MRDVTEIGGASRAETGINRGALLRIGTRGRKGVRARNCKQEPEFEAVEKASAIGTNLDLNVGTLTHRRVRIVMNQSSDNLSIQLGDADTEDGAQNR